MKAQEIVQEIEKLGLSEKLLLVEDIWDGIARNNGELPMPEWQKTEIDKRYREFKKGHLECHNWESVHEDIRNKYR